LLVTHKGDPGEGLDICSHELLKHRLHCLWEEATLAIRFKVGEITSFEKGLLL
jgi:hypothetical protein